MRKFINIILIVILFASCTTYREVIVDREIIKHDSIVAIDTVYNDVHIKGDTVLKTDTLINIDTIIKYRYISIDTLRIKGKYSDCEGGVTRNKPFLNLFEKDIKLRIASYEKLIKVKDITIIEKTSEVEKIKNRSVFMNSWFWYCLVAWGLLILFLYFKIKGGLFKKLL